MGEETDQTPETQVTPPLWRRVLPWALPPLLVVLFLALLLLWFEGAPPVPFQYTAP